MSRFITNILILLLIANNCYGLSVIGGLNTNSIYNLVLDGKTSQIESSIEGSVKIDIPEGGHQIELNYVKTITPVVTNTPTPEITNTLTATPTRRRPSKIGKTVVSLYDETERINKIDIISTTGMSLTGTVEILNTVENKSFCIEGKDDLIFVSGFKSNKIYNESYDYNGDFVNKFEISFKDNIEVEDAKRYFENESNHFSYIINSGTKTYFNCYDEMGYEESNVLIGEDSKFLNYLNEDVDHDGYEDNFILHQNKNGAVIISRISNNNLEDNYVLFGSGLDYKYIDFVNLNDDNEKEIVVICRSKSQECFRMIVINKNGQVLLKKNLLTGRFEDEALFLVKDIDNDSKEEFVVSGTLLTGSKIVQVIDDNNRQIFAKSVVDFNYNVIGIEAININDDPNKEILVLSSGTDNTLVLSVLDVTGALVNEYVLENNKLDNVNGNILFSKDIDSDNFEEVFLISYLNDSSSNISNLLDNQEDYNQISFSSLVSSII